MRQILKEICQQIGQKRFREWCHESDNIFVIECLIIILGLEIIGVILLCTSITGMDKLALLYIGMLFIYIYGVVYSLWNKIKNKSRKFKNEMWINKDNPEVVIRTMEYLSICFCIVEVIKQAYPFIVVFMVYLLAKVVNMEQTILDYVNVSNYGIITYFLVTMPTIAIIMGFRTTDIMIVLNTDKGYEKKIKKLTKKYKK